MTVALSSVVTSLGALLWSFGYLDLVGVLGKLGASLCFLFIFDLFVSCKRFLSSLCIGSAVELYL
jgi:hypothetical protein